MKVALILATDGSTYEDAVLAPFRSAAFLDGLRTRGIAPVVIAVAPDDAAAAAGASSEGLLRCTPRELAALVASHHVEAVQTFGPEHRVSDIWPMAAAAGLPIMHCVSCWRGSVEAALSSSRVSSLAARRAKRASRQVVAVVGTGRGAVGAMMEAGYFPNAMFSAIVPPPVTLDAAAASAAPERRTDPVFGVYDPYASSDLITFAARALDLAGRRNLADIRIAMGAPPAKAPASVSIVPAADIGAFLATIDVLAVPAYDDSLAAPLIAALRAGKSVIVPDPSGAAELIEYGRHGLMFSADSAYHFANALDLLGQSWRQRPVLLADGGPAIARTHPATVAQDCAAAFHRVAAGHGGVQRTSSHG
jgi:glycosyl transferase family 1